MALMVKHNLAAVDTLNQLNKNDSALQKDLQKVSSGMKINSAADDASGYAIADRMDVQLQSLDQDQQNTQNGQSLLRVAEGAVSSTVDILRTLKEKAINAANDTNTDDDRATIQKEFDQAIDQIDDNAGVTYNGKTLIDGSKNHYVVPGGTANVLTNKNFSIYENFDIFTPLDQLKDRSGRALSIQSTDSIVISYFKGGNFVEKTIPALSPFGDVLSLTGTFDEEPMKQDFKLTYATDGDPTYIGTDHSGNTVHAVDAQMAINIRAAEPGIDNQIVGFNYCIIDKDGKPRTDLNNIFNDFQETIPAENATPDNELNFQTGTKANNVVRVAFADMRARALGLRTGNDPEVNLSVRTQSQANSALQALDTALQKALDQQTNIGATESKLDFTHSNLMTSSENTQASMSTIRDANMAQMMTAYTKDSILSQTAQAMLAQANQSSSSVLQLLQGQ
ncbi:MAG: flagellin [Selenomonadaceae bacterium]|nr:flagellin [Selenomonadaceae bacterium]